MAQLFLGGGTVNELAHDAADHIQVDIQHTALQILLLSAISLGAQQSPLLAAAPDKAQTVAVGLPGELLGDAQKADAAIVVMTVVGTEDIHKNTPLRTTNVYLDVLDIIPAERAKEARTETLGAEIRNLIETNLEKRSF